MRADGYRSHSPPVIFPCGSPQVFNVSRGRSVASVIDKYPAAAQCGVRVSNLYDGETAALFVSAAINTVWASWNNDGRGSYAASRLLGLPSIRLCDDAMLFIAPERGSHSTKAWSDHALAQESVRPIVPPTIVNLYLWGQKLPPGIKRQITLKSRLSGRASIEFTFGDGGSDSVWIPVPTDGIDVDWPSNFR